MEKPAPPRAFRLTATILLHILVLLSACDRQEARRVTSATLVGDAVCVDCHTGMAPYAETAHKRTSARATPASIHASFEEGENVLATSNPYLHYRMEAGPDELRQSAIQGSGGDTAIVSAPIDLVIGSGRKGQTYLFWRENALLQLPVSYWTGIGWANSPGYPDGMVNFQRPVNPRCLECHTTYAESETRLAGANLYDTASVVVGISCESCHGAGGEHVEAMSRAGRWLPASAIVNPAKLPRERQLDGCALCHGGIGESIQPPFSYRPGEPLSAYLHQPTPPPGAAVDVHGNQVALLARSPCFQATGMTCSTCHDVHRPQRQVAEFSAVCTSCHAPGEEIPAEHGFSAPGNCVDCHMPELPTNVIVGDGAGRVLRPMVRTHWITVYPGTAGALDSGSNARREP